MVRIMRLRMRPNLKSSAILVPDPVTCEETTDHGDLAKRLRAFKRTGCWIAAKPQGVAIADGDRQKRHTRRRQGLVRHSIPGQLTSVERVSRCNGTDRT